ncbi:hypothetical protein SUGI_1018030 [Cryptomeria japonica]|uniref:molybdopterin synthase catalytic subunit n=1 Tax=Cryptomeria japonica TaxID=3369 RepID=UPI00241494A0|nr:molybdopterin synthase catalytic subunit [Cryptomeria japonica]XP_057843073.2 molybdopterin synthase catalytic subunit [Cryptomeria japonica]GLJ48208.1 hypothetical protein SUGI_1018030 [Cryptomeria japonica]
MVEDFVEIVDEAPLDITKYTNLVRSPAAGAIATFMGTTRDTFEDKEVVELRYEAYVPMAHRQLRAICTEARNRWELMRVAVAHRLGVVPVGEESVFVAVSSVHRRDALEACEYVIDEIKASVPIWKKEIYTNGEVWKENSEFLLRKPEPSRQQADSKANKSGQHFRCCGHKERVSVNGDDFEDRVVGNSEKETEGNGHFEGEVNAERCIREEDCQG